MPISHRIRRWNEEIGSRSNRAPALTGVSSSFLPRYPRKTVEGQGLGCQPAVLVKGILLSCLKELLAPSRSGGIEFENAVDQCVRVAAQPLSGAHLRDEPGLQGELGRDGFAEQHQGKGEPWERVFAKIRHDSGGCETEAHFRETQGGVFADKRKIANDGHAETETKRVALHLSDADQRRTPQGTLEFNEANGFLSDTLRVPPGALPAGAENLASRAHAQYTCLWIRGFLPQLRQHRVEHGAVDLVAMINIVQSKGQNLLAALDAYTGPAGIRQGKGVLGRHARHRIQPTQGLSTDLSPKTCGNCLRYASSVHRTGTRLP